MRTIQSDEKLMSLIGVKEVSRLICGTNMGPLNLRLRKGETEYRFNLDGVELNKETNKELMELLYPPTPVKSIITPALLTMAGKKYIAEQVGEGEQFKVNIELKKKLGRPKKNDRNIKKLAKRRNKENNLSSM